MNHNAIARRCIPGVVLFLTLTIGSYSQAQPIVANGDFAAPLPGTWNIGGKTKVEPHLVPAQIEADKTVTRALQLNLTAPNGANPWDFWVKAPNATFAIAKGDLIGVQFWARSTSPTKLNAIYQQGAPSFEKSIREVVGLQPQWQKFAFFVPAKAALEADGSNFELQMGQTTGTVELAAIRVEDLGTISVADAQTRFAIPPAPGAAVPVPVPAPAAPFKLRPRKAPPYVVLKLDDVGATGKGEVPPRWKKVADFVKERNIHAAFGIICNSLEGDKPVYFNWIKEQQASGRIEFWNHGYDHKEWEENGQKVEEFKGPSYEQQKDHLVRSEALCREKLGFPLVTFGAPFNTIDANTVKAMSEVPDFKIWLYGDPKTPGGKVVLERPAWLGIENPIFIPSLDRFIRPYSNHADTDCLVIQGHANMWDDAKFAEFVKIVDFLTEQKAVFVTPSEYVALKKLSAP